MQVQSILAFLNMFGIFCLLLNLSYCSDLLVVNSLDSCGAVSVTCQPKDGSMIGHDHPSSATRLTPQPGWAPGDPQPCPSAAPSSHGIPQRRGGDRCLSAEVRDG